MPTLITKGVLAGSTYFLDVSIKDPDTRIGFKPDLLLMSVYDVTWSGNGQPRCVGPTVTFPSTATQTIVNSRNDVDVTDSIDANGEGSIELTPEDTAVEVPSGPVPSRIWRRILLRGEWDGSPAKVVKQEIVFPVIPDRETLAV